MQNPRWLSRRNEQARQKGAKRVKLSSLFILAAESSSEERRRVEVKGGEERDVEDEGEEEEEGEQMIQTQTTDQKSHQISTVDCFNGKTSAL